MLKESNLIITKLKEHRALIGLLYIFSLVLAVTTLFISLLSGPAIKVFIDPKAKINIDPQILEIMGLFKITASSLLIETVIIQLPILLIGLATVRFFLQASVFGGWELIGEGISKDIRESLIKCYVYLDPKVKMNVKTKEIETSIATVISNETYTLKYYIVRFFGGIPREIVLSILLFSALFLISVKLTVIFMLVLLPLSLFLSKLAKKIKKRTRAEFDRQNELAEWIQQRITGMETIKHYGSEKKELADMEEFSRSLLGKQIKSAKTSARGAPISEAMTILAVALIFYFANIYRSEIGLSGSALISYFSCLAFLSQSINKISKYVNILSKGKAALTKIKGSLEFMTDNSKEDIKAVFEPIKDETALEISGLSFSYDDKVILSDLNRRFEYGKMYALVGPSGSGKSTLVNLILKCLDPKSGSITARKHPGLPNEIVYMPQVLEGSYLSIAEIISYPRSDYQKDEVISALKKAEIYKTLRDKGLSVESELGFGSTKLSGGEWQRLNLARIFYRPAAIIIADESTSALDPQTEKRIIGEFKNLARKGSCIITVAHRPSIIEACDESYCLTAH